MFVVLGPCFCLLTAGHQSSAEEVEGRFGPGLAPGAGGSLPALEDGPCLWGFASPGGKKVNTLCFPQAHLAHRPHKILTELLRQTHVVLEKRTAPR